jgi:sodium/bile acid cotransporter 7
LVFCGSFNGGFHQFKGRTVLAKLRPDGFTCALVVTVLLGSFFPCPEPFVPAFGRLTQVAIALLFFLHGARLSTETVIAGFTHWRLHIVILAVTFVLFPIVGLLLGFLSPSLISPALYSGLLFLCVLPSTVQSSIAFTSIAGGNVPAAICAASASNIGGVLMTPLLVGLLFQAQGGGAVGTDVVESIALQLLAPFIAGQLLRPWVGAWVLRHKKVLGFTDRGSILLVVYLAFSEAVASGIWHQVSLTSLLVVAIVDAVLLGLVLLVTTFGSRLLGFSRADEITIVFCGSKKTLASGIPMANIIFAGQGVGTIVLPLMLFHQIQLMACSIIARKYAEANSKAADQVAADQAASAQSAIIAK